MQHLRAGALGLSFVLLAPPLTAQETPAVAGDAPSSEAGALAFGTQGRTGRTAYITATLGLRASPEYFGSDEMSFGPSFRGGLAYLDSFGLNFGEPEFRVDPYARPTGLGYGLSFRFIRARESDDFDELEGLDDIDPTLEVGGVVGYAWTNVEALGEIRYGFGGSDSWVGELRANYVMRPNDRLAIRVGPRLLFGTDNYMDTYFGVTEEEGARSGLDAYDPDPGLVSAGLEAIASYQLADRWWLEGAVRWQHFEGDAGDSPIVRQGSADHTQVRIGIRRALVLRF